MMDKSRIAKKLIALRGKRTQSTVAQDVGISSSALAMYERGDRIPRDEIKIRLANYYKTTVGNIFYGC